MRGNWGRRGFLSSMRLKDNHMENGLLKKKRGEDARLIEDVGKNETDLPVHNEVKGRSAKFIRHVF